MGGRGSRIAAILGAALSVFTAWTLGEVGSRAAAADPTIEITCCVDSLQVVGSPATVLVTVRDGAGDPVEGVKVVVGVVSGPNLGGAATSLTDTAGGADFNRHGSEPGRDLVVVKAEVDGVVVAAGAELNWVAAEPTTVVLAQSSAESRVGSQNVLTATVTADGGVPVAEVPVTFERDGATNLVARTDAAGAAVHPVTNETPGTETFRATVGPADLESDVLTHTWTPVASLSLSAPASVGATGGEHTVTATALDPAAAALAGADVTFTVVSGPNAGAGGTVTTDASGEAPFTYTGSGSTGLDVIAASMVDAEDITIEAQPAERAWVPPTGPALVLAPLDAENPTGSLHTMTVVAAVDGAGLAAEEVAFEVVAGPQAGEGGTATTGGDGFARFEYQGVGVGTDTIRASFESGAGQVVSNDATKTWAPIPALTLTPVDATNFVGETHTLTASLTDTDGTPMAGERIVFLVLGATLVDGTSVTDAAGVATFSYMGLLGGTDSILVGANTAEDVNPTAGATKTWIDLSRATLTLTPDTATNPVGTAHTVTGTLRAESGAPVAGIGIDFRVASGPHRGVAASGETDAEGEATFTFTGVAGGTDSIEGSFFAFGKGTVKSEPVEKVWEGEQVPTMVLAPPAMTAPTGSDHILQAYLNHGDDEPAGDGIEVTFEVMSGPHAGLSWAAPTDEDGVAFFSYFGLFPGVDEIVARATVDESETTSNTATMDWTGDPILVLTLDPPNATNPVGTDHTVTATLAGEGAPVAETEISFEVIDGPNAGVTGTDDTDAEGVATFTYTGEAAGTDTIVARTTISIWSEGTGPHEYTVEADPAAKTWESEQPAGLTLMLSPAQATADVGKAHTVTATLQDEGGAPVAAATVAFSVSGGPHAGTTGTAETDAAGQAIFTYTGSAVGKDVVVATTTVDAVVYTSNSVSVTWADEVVDDAGDDDAGDDDGDDGGSDGLPVTGSDIGRMILGGVVVFLLGAVLLAGHTVLRPRYRPRHMRP